MRLTSYHGKNRHSLFLCKSDSGFSFGSTLLFIFIVSMLAVCTGSLIVQKRKLIEKETAYMHKRIESGNREAEAGYESL